MFYLVSRLDEWFNVTLLPFAYGYDMQDPTCPAAKIPVRMLEVVLTFLALLVDLVLIPAYLIWHLFAWCKKGKGTTE
jgi:hypothetical protein